MVRAIVNTTQNPETSVTNGASAGDASGNFDIMRASALQNARVCKWEGWTWKSFQHAIVKANHKISDLDKQRDELLAACKVAAAFLPHVTSLETPAEKALHAAIANAERGGK